MSRMRAVMIAVPMLAIVSVASAQERFLFDNLAYTAASPRGPVTFSETQFPTGTVLNGKSVSALNAVALPAALAFTFKVYDMPSSDATVTDDFDLLPFFNLDGDMVEGTTGGVIGINFGTTATSVSFGFALNNIESIASACTVTAFDSSGNVVGSSTTSADPVVVYTEGEGGFASTAGFRRIEVKFASSFPDRIPALSGWGLAVLVGLVGLAGAALLRRGCA
jgi:hypothetical protein